ncbi:Neuroblastoma Breakpoint Family Member 6 [Manis pentadactyla]|nr:Neuroblastoma Breakpoint Family Member 6 [Manis pentadactyla]
MPFIVSLMSQGLGNGHMKPVALGLLLHATTAESLELLSYPSTEISLWEGNQDLKSLLAKRKMDASSLEGSEHSRVSSFPLMQGLCFSESEEYRDIIQSLLEEKLHLGQGTPAEKQMLADMLKECITLTEDQEQDLAQLKHKLQEVGKVSVLLKQHL